MENLIIFAFSLRKSSFLGKKSFKILDEYILISEYERFCSQEINQYEGISVSMKEKELYHLNKYTGLLDT